MLDIPSQHMHYCDLLLCEVYCFIVAYCVKASSVLCDETRAPPPPPPLPGVLLEIFGGSVPLGSPNPDPI